MNEKIRRRDFFRKTAMLTAGLFVIPKIIPAVYPVENIAEKGNPLLNPAFRMKELETGELELFTHLEDKSKLSELFGGLDADIIREILNGHNPLGTIGVLAYRHNLSYPECRRKTKRLMNDLQQSGIIYFGDKMLVKIQEA
jgi:hypothetical protein